MKATGIVRRIDDLGRVVIPKEIRRTLRIRVGDPLEIFTDKEGGVVFRKYSLMGDLQVVAGQICDTASKTLGCGVLICDRDTVIAAAGVNRRETMERHISPALERIMEGRKLWQHRPGMEVLTVTEDGSVNMALVSPIITEGDVMGCVVFGEREQGGMGDTECKLAQTISGFLGRHMES